MTDMRKLASGLAQWRAEVETAFGREKSRLAGAVFAAVVRRTPVASGGARAGWTRDDGAPFARAVIANAVPYVATLEHGGSRQAPHGMVAATAADFAAGTLGEPG